MAMKVPAWIVGPVVATAVFGILGFQFGLFASGGGLLIAAAGAFWAGAGVAAMIDPRRSWRNALVVAVWIVAAVSGLVVWAQRASDTLPPDAPPGAAHGGPNVPPPEGVRPVPPPPPR